MFHGFMPVLALATPDGPVRTSKTCMWVWQFTLPLSVRSSEPECDAGRSATAILNRSCRTPDSTVQYPLLHPLGLFWVLGFDAGTSTRPRVWCQVALAATSAAAQNCCWWLLLTTA